MTPDTQLAPAPDADARPVFAAPYAPPDEAIAAGLLAQASRPAEAERRIESYATRLIEGIRARTGGLGGIEDFLHAYSLSTKEGLALMVLAEALLRVPDAATADRLIEDKLADRRLVRPRRADRARLLVTASAWTLGVTARIIQSGRDAREHPRKPGQAARPAGRAHRDPPGDAAARARISCSGRPSRRRCGGRAGTAICAIRSTCWARARARAADAERYLAAYARAIEAIGASAGDGALPNRPGISVKLSALHPRFEAVSRRRVLAELVPDLIELARQARQHDLNFTVDAEEADRLELTLEVIARGARRSLAARLGGLRARRAGLPEARAGGDRLAGGDRATRSDAG